MIVGLAPGGIADQAARIVAPKLSEALGQQIVVENRTGAGGAIAAEFVAKAPGDGSIIMMGFDGTLVTAPAVQPNQPYNVLTDLKAISKIADSPLLITGAPNLKVRTLKDFLALAKAQPGKWDYGTAGIGSTGHLVGELLELRAGVFMVHIPYRGGGQAVADLIGSQIPLMLGAAAASQAHVKAGTAIGLATTGAKRLAILPDVPTVRESGIKGLEQFEAYSWVGLLGPKSMPPATVARFHDAAVKVLADPAMRARLEAIGAVPVGNTPAEFAAQMKADIERWTALVKAAGITAN
jgi:tripartite-type tricarboxylate transporter receptor subunit TctC